MQETRADIDEEIIVNRKLGEGAYLAGVPTKLLLPWTAILVILGCAYVAIKSITEVSPYWFIYLYLVGMAMHWHLLRKNPWEFIGKFIEAPKWRLGYPKFIYKKGEISKEKVGKRKISQWGGEEGEVKAFEDELHLVSLVEFRLDERKVGAYLLKKNGTYKLIFPFRLMGINENTSPLVLAAKIKRIREGLRSLPKFETVTISIVRMSSCKERVSVLKRLWEKCSNPKVRYIINGIGRRVKKLKQLHRHNPIEAIVRVSYTLEIRTERDGIEQTLEALNDWRLKYLGEKAKQTQVKIKNKLIRSYYQGFIAANNLLRQQLGLKARSCSVSEIHQYEHFRVNNKPPHTVKPPQVIIVTKRKIWPEFNCSTHLCTYWHLNAIPVADKRWVKLPGINKYVGGAVLVEKPGKLKRAKEQLKIASSIVNSSEDVEVVIELSLPDQQQALDVARWRVKDSHAEAKTNNSSGKIDRKGKRNLDEDIAVEDKFYDHEVAINMAMVVMAYRDNPTEVELALSQIASLPFFSPPALLLKEGLGTCALLFPILFVLLL